MYMNRRTILKRSAFLLLSAAVIGGCSTDVPTGTDEELGRVVVTIKDNNNAPLQGILVDLFVTSN